MRVIGGCVAGLCLLVVVDSENRNLQGEELRFNTETIRRFKHVAENSSRHGTCDWRCHVSQREVTHDIPVTITHSAAVKYSHNSCASRPIICTSTNKRKAARSGLFYDAKEKESIFQFSVLTKIIQHTGLTSRSTRKMKRARYES